MLLADQGYIYDFLREIGLSDFAARTGEFLLVRPLKILLILLAAMVFGRIAGRAMRRFVRTSYHRAPVRPQTPRAAQRADTVGDVVANVVRGAFMVMAVVLILGELGVNLTPIVAGAGIAGLAIGFGAQSLVKDVITGLFILIEDQYGVGDVVTLENATGTVEDVTLRVTRLRSVDGTVWFVPNGEIRKVGNSSMEWSRALVDVQVAYDADIGRASVGILEEANAMAGDEAWREAVLEPPELWVVQAMDKDGVTIRLVIKTAPRQQFVIARELRGRIIRRLQRDRVKGPGQPVVVSAGPLDQGSPPAPPRPDTE